MKPIAGMTAKTRSQTILKMAEQPFRECIVLWNIEWCHPSQTTDNYADNAIAEHLCVCWIIVRYMMWQTQCRRM